MPNLLECFVLLAENKKIPPPRLLSWGRDLLSRYHPGSPIYRYIRLIRYGSRIGCLYPSSVTGAPVAPSRQPVPMRRSETWFNEGTPAPFQLPELSVRLPHSSTLLFIAFLIWYIVSSMIAKVNMRGTVARTRTCLHSCSA